MSFVYAQTGVEWSGVPRDVAYAVQRAGKPDELWNYLWLSLPAIEREGVPLMEALEVLHGDLVDHRLSGYLAQPPWIFSQWMLGEDASIFDAYILLGEDRGLESILGQAATASKKHRSTLQRVDGNVAFIRPVRT